MDEDAEGEGKSAPWICLKCTLASNSPDSFECVACGTLRPRVPSQSPPKPPPPAVTPKRKHAVKSKSRLQPGEEKCVLCWSYPNTPEAEGPLQVVTDPTICSKHIKSKSGLLPGPVFVHENCALFCPQIRKGKDGLLNVSAELRRGWPLKCTLCRARGALYGCHKTSCRRTYHYMCAKEAGCVMDQWDHTIHCKGCWSDVFEEVEVTTGTGSKTTEKVRKSHAIRDGEDKQDEEEEEEEEEENSDSDDKEIIRKSKKYHAPIVEEIDTDDESLLAPKKKSKLVEEKPSPVISGGSSEKRKTRSGKAFDIDDEDEPIGVKIKRQKKKREKETGGGSTRARSKSSSHTKKTKSPLTSLIKAGEKKCVFCCTFTPSIEMTGELVKVAHPEKCEHQAEFDHSLSTAPCWVHKQCALYSPKVFQNERDEMMNISLEVKRGWSLKCYKCRQLGGLYGCWKQSCKKSFHLTCASKAGLTLNTKDWSIYCPGCIPGAPPQKRIRRPKTVPKGVKKKVTKRKTTKPPKPTKTTKVKETEEISSSSSTDSSDSESSSSTTTTSSESDSESESEEEKEDDEEDRPIFFNKPALATRETPPPTKQEKEKLSQAIQSLALLSSSNSSSDIVAGKKKLTSSPAAEITANKKLATTTTTTTTATTPSSSSISAASEVGSGKKLATKSLVGVKKQPATTPTPPPVALPSNFPLIPLGKKFIPGYQARQEARAHSWRDEGQSRLLNVVLPTAPIPVNHPPPTPTVVVTSSSHAPLPKSILKSSSTATTPVARNPSSSATISSSTSTSSSTSCLRKPASSSNGTTATSSSPSSSSSCRSSHPSSPSPSRTSSHSSQPPPSQPSHPSSQPSPHPSSLPPSHPPSYSSSHSFSYPPSHASQPSPHPYPSSYPPSQPSFPTISPLTAAEAAVAATFKRPPRSPSKKTPSVKTEVRVKSEPRNSPSDNSHNQGAPDSLRPTPRTPPRSLHPPLLSSYNTSQSNGHPQLRPSYSPPPTSVYIPPQQYVPPPQQYAPPQYVPPHQQYIPPPPLHALPPTYSPPPQNPYLAQPFAAPPPPLVGSFPTRPYPPDLFPPRGHEYSAEWPPGRRSRSTSRSRKRSHRSSSRERHRRSRSRERRSRSREHGYSRDRRSRSRDRRRSRSRERRGRSPDHKRVGNGRSLGRMDVENCLASERGECNNSNCPLLHGKCNPNSQITCMNRLVDRRCPEFWGQGCPNRHLIPKRR